MNKMDDGSWEHVGQVDCRPRYKPAISPLSKAAGVRCSITHLMWCPPLQHPCCPTLQLDPISNSKFEVDKPSTCKKWPHIQHPMSTPYAPSWVTDGYYTN